MTRLCACWTAVGALQLETSWHLRWPSAVPPERISMMGYPATTACHTMCSRCCCLGLRLECQVVSWGQRPGHLSCAAMADLETLWQTVNGVGCLRPWREYTLMVTVQGPLKCASPAAACPSSILSNVRLYVSHPVSVWLTSLCTTS